MAFLVIVLFARVRWVRVPELSRGESAAFFVARAIPPRDYRAGGLGFLNTTAPHAAAGYQTDMLLESL
ncbi:hypothetical protein [Burkholderia sp. BCC0044]|uniref:hypothetical protein n=1 Tax=Burkholderia sp. BCC0044 TaxID=2676295 RepID=UPI0015898528|nr:hypothetical protein [Burkholderia sp. BCC0044]